MEAQTSSWSAGRIALLAGGILIGLVALGIAAAGGTGVWADTTQRDSNGYVSTGLHEFRSPARAITTTSVDIGTDVPEWLFGKVRVEAVSRNSGSAVFVGIARKTDVDRYLEGVDRDVVKDLDFDPFNVTYEHRPGTAAPGSPASQSFWSASAQGTGTVSLKWGTKSGSWSVVVMNADGSPGVAADVKAGAKIPYALWFGIGALVLGVLVLLGAALMVRASLRRPGSGSAPAAPAAAS